MMHVANMAAIGARPRSTWPGHPNAPDPLARRAHAGTMIVGHPHAPPLRRRVTSQRQVSTEGQEHSTPGGVESRRRGMVGRQGLGGSAKVRVTPGASRIVPRSGSTVTKRQPGTGASRRDAATRPRDLLERAVVAERDQRLAHRRVDVAAGTGRRGAPRKRPRATPVRPPPPIPPRRSTPKVRVGANREHARSNSSTTRLTATTAASTRAGSRTATSPTVPNASRRIRSGGSEDMAREPNEEA